MTTSQDYFSSYIFRGVAVLNSNPIWVPSVVATYKNLTAYYSGYYGSGSDTVPGNKWYEEDDFAADVHQGLFGDKLTLTAGAYGYLYPDGKSGKDTYEFYGKVAWANYVNPYIALNWDVHAIEGGYGAAGVTHTYDLTQMLKLKEGQSLSIIPSAQLGISFGYTQSDVNWNDVLLGINIPFNITPALSVHAQYQCSIALNSAHAVGAGNYSIADVGISYSFQRHVAILVFQPRRLDLIRAGAVLFGHAGDDEQTDRMAQTAIEGHTDDRGAGLRRAGRTCRLSHARRGFFCDVLFACHHAGHVVCRQGGGHCHRLRERRFLVDYGIGGGTTGCANLASVLDGT